MQIKSKTQQLLEQAYQSVYEDTQGSPLSEAEANSLLQGFNMLPGDRKKDALNKLQGLVGKEVSLSRAVGLKQSTGYGRDDGSATVPGSGGSVAHTETESIDGEFAKGIIQDVKVSEGQDDYTKNGNLILTIKGQDHNVNQGTTVKVKFLEDTPAQVHDAGRRSYRSGATLLTGHGRFSGMRR